MLKLRKIESLVQLRNLLKTSQQHPQQEARCRHFCKQLEHGTYAYVENSTKLFPVRVLLDSGSQRSYITNHLKTKLGLIAIKTKTLNLNTFDNEKFSKRDSDLIKLRLQGKHGEDVNISALRFEAICSPVP